MKLITFTQGAAPRPGLALSERVGLDLLAADPSLPATWNALFAELERVHEICSQYRQQADDLAGDTRPELPLFALESAELLPPIILPSKIIAVGRNYRDHAEEQNQPVPEVPLLFSKAPSCLQSPRGAIALAAELDRVDAEAELALVIGKPGRAIAADDAAAHIAGYMCMNDVSDRAAQFADKQFFRGKSIDTGGPCGPWLVTPDELPAEALGLDITCHWNGELMQNSNTEQLIFTPHFLVSYVSRNMTLLPGDIITTGTPGGVGVFRDPPRFLKPGDVIEVAIAGIGTITNPVVRWERSEQSSPGRDREASQ